MRLIIKERGHVLNIPGFSTMRTPCKINVDMMDLKILITHLKQIGISNYIIEENQELNDIDKKRPILSKFARVVKAIKDEPDIIIKRVDDVGTKIELDKMNKKIDELQKMILMLLKPTPLKAELCSTNDNFKPKVNYKKQIIEELDEENFIPEISFDDMEYSKGNSEVEIIEINDDLEDEIKDLSNLRRKQ